MVCVHVSICTHVCSGHSPNVCMYGVCMVYGVCVWCIVCTCVCMVSACVWYVVVHMVCVYVCSYGECARVHIYACMFRTFS